MAKKRQLWTDKMSEFVEGMSAQRRQLLSDIASELGRPEALVVSYFADPTYGAMLDYQVDLLKDLLQAAEKPGPLVLIVDSLGGEAHAAECMVELCREYGGGAYSVVVPKSAKSAATLVCLGAQKVYMGPAAELGPVDPQTIDPNTRRPVSAYSYCDAYFRLTNSAERSKGKVDAYCQQLRRFDDVLVEEAVREIKLSEQLALDLLVGKGGMWSGKKQNRALARRLQFLTDIDVKGSHDRPIFCEELKRAGLNVDSIDRNSDLWSLLWQITQDTAWFVENDYTCIMETKDRTVVGPDIEELKRTWKIEEATDEATPLPDGLSSP